MTLCMTSVWPTTDKYCALHTFPMWVWSRQPAIIILSMPQGITHLPTPPDYKLSGTVKPVLMTTCIQRPSVVGMTIFLFILTSFKRPPLYKDHFLWAHIGNLIQVSHWIERGGGRFHFQCSGRYRINLLKSRYYQRRLQLSKGLELLCSNHLKQIPCTLN